MTSEDVYNTSFANQSQEFNHDSGPYVKFGGGVGVVWGGRGRGVCVVVLSCESQLVNAMKPYHYR